MPENSLVIASILQAYILGPCSENDEIFDIVANLPGTQHKKYVYKCRPSGLIVFLL